MARHTSRKARALRRAQANTRTGAIAFHKPHNEAKWHDMPKRIKPWQACLGTKSNRLCPGNVGELQPEPATPKDTTYQHQPLQPASNLWADVVHASDSDTTKGNRYHRKHST